MNYLHAMVADLQRQVNAEPPGHGLMVLRGNELVARAKLYQSKREYALAESCLEEASSFYVREGICSRSI